MVAQHYKLDVRQYQRVERVTGYDGEFRVDTQDLYGTITNMRRGS